ncbi:hypothetical protein HZR84_01665 [Hyphobacterium sp. CCMP332]|nr:hypothetical protein HZR84_01665 [Hyphobacterium sp. CCMP332]
MNIKKYLAEGFLIVFSVLFALFINQLVEDYKTKKRKIIALESIHKELVQNEEILTKWRDKHVEIRNRISSIMSGEMDSLKIELMQYDYLNLGVLTNNESLIDAILTSTAWESARSTGIVSEFDFETTQKLTHVYSMQQNITDKTLMKIIDYYFDSDAHDLKEIDRTLLQFQLRFSELTGQENLMAFLYAEAIKSTENELD